MKNTMRILGLIGIFVTVLVGCNGLPDIALLRLEAANDGYYYAVEIDNDFVGKVLYAVGDEPDYVEQFISVGEHTVSVAAYGAPADYFADNPPALGPKEITLDVPASGTSYIFSIPFFYPLP